MLVCKSCHAEFEEQHKSDCIYCLLTIPAEYEQVKISPLCGKQCQEAIATGFHDICIDGCILNLNYGNNN